MNQEEWIESSKPARLETGFSSHSHERIMRIYIEFDLTNIQHYHHITIRDVSKSLYHYP